MSDTEDSDDVALRELMQEYAKKENKKEEYKQNENTMKKKKKRGSKANLDMSVPMDKQIFGDKDSLMENLTKAVEKKDLYNIEDNKQSKKRQPVWNDPDDEEIKLGDVKKKTKYNGPLDHLNMDKSYKEFLTARFKRMVQQPKWASLDTKPEQSDSEDEILQTAGYLQKPEFTALPPKHIRIKRLKDLNRSFRSQGAITNIQFHPTSTAALVGGEFGHTTIYSVDGERNEVLHTMHFEEFPIKCMKITPDGSKVVLGSQRVHYYLYDLHAAKETRYIVRRRNNYMHNFTLSPCGRYMAAAGTFGALHLYDFKSQEIIHDFKQEHFLTDIKFTSDSKRIICGSQSNYVNIYSLRQRKLEHSFIDEGCLVNKTLDLAPNQRLLATGSKEGVVNVYDFDKVMKSKTPEPDKRFLNLRTEIFKVKFNHSSEILGFTSKAVNNAIKLAHFPSATVFSNFPVVKADFGKIGVIEFSPRSGFLALGNRKREAPLLRLKHYSNY